LPVAKASIVQSSRGGLAQNDQPAEADNAPVPGFGSHGAIVALCNHHNEVTVKRVLRMALGAMIVFTVLGGPSVLPIATHSLALVSAQQVPASLEAFQTIPKRHRAELLAAMTPEAIVSILNQQWDMLLAKDDTSAQLKAILERLKPLTNVDQLLKGRKLMDHYQAERRKWQDGIRADEPDPSEGYDPAMWAILLDLQKLPAAERAKASYMALPELPEKNPPKSGS
jgi:hypothetical protein